LNHFMHAVRRNMDITYVVMDNQIYGLTKGQHSPTSAHGFKAKTTPAGNIENALVPTQIALAAGISYLAQGFSSDVNQLVRLIQQGMEHKGFSLINVFSPCVTYNKINTYDWYKENVFNLDQVTDYDPTDRAAAMNMVIEKQGLATGLIYRDDSRLAYEDLISGYKEEAIVAQELGLDPAVFEAALKEFA